MAAHSQLSIVVGIVPIDDGPRLIVEGMVLPFGEVTFRLALTFADGNSWGGTASDMFDGSYVLQCWRAGERWLYGIVDHDVTAIDAPECDSWLFSPEFASHSFFAARTIAPVSGFELTLHTREESSARRTIVVGP